jgi:hypothetical protein
MSSPALAGITGAWRDRTALITSVLSTFCRYRGRGEIGVAELALDHPERRALAGHLDGMA